MGNAFDSLGKLKEPVSFLARQAFGRKTGLDAEVIASSGPSLERDDLDALKEQFAQNPAIISASEQLLKIVEAGPAVEAAQAATAAKGVKHSKSR